MRIEQQIAASTPEMAPLAPIMGIVESVLGKALGQHLRQFNRNNKIKQDKNARAHGVLDVIAEESQIQHVT